LEKPENGMCIAAFDVVVVVVVVDYDDDKESVRPGFVKHCTVTSFKLHYI